MEKKEKNQEKWYETMTVKMILLGIMAFAFLIPLQLIKMVIRERESNSLMVKQEISESWGKQQTVSGPILNVPVYRQPSSNEVKTEAVRRIWHILPEELNLDGTIEPQKRHKGIYETVIYESKMEIAGRFKIPNQGKKANYTVLWDEAYITMGISDNRGIVENIILGFNGKEIKAEPGLADQDLFQSGISFPVSPDPISLALDFDMSISLRGSGGLYFIPVGESTTVNINSSWEAPSFKGNFLPSPMTIDENGFRAKWNVTHLNRNFPREWVGSIHDIAGEAFGVDLILEIDHYQKSERSAKYGLLFIAFTFLVLLFIELSSDKRIHIFSYFLVSLGLILFFSLLTSLSEHLGFSPSYIIASIATIALISGFSGSLLKSKKSVLTIAGLLTVLYIFLFFLLALNEYAYLAGNIGLFIGLAAIMWLTSKTDKFRKNEL